MSRGNNPYRRPDSFTRAAKAQGYPARSVFKLEEIDRRVRLFRTGQRVLDLGAAPGSWTMYAASRVGRGGSVLAVDLCPLSVALGPNVAIVQGDALALEDEALRRGAPYDVVLSDMAPSTTGSRISDQARSFELFDRAAAVAEALGLAGGAFVGKLFMSDDFPKAKARIQSSFADVRVIRPEGTRRSSFEVFIVGCGKTRGPIGG